MVRQSILLFVLCLAAMPAQGQLLRRTLPGRSVTAQFAGSTGMFSLGGMRHTRNERWGVGLSYGHTPEGHGGPINAYTLRLMYTPWKLPLTERWRWEPVQTGVFVSYSTGLDLSSHWPSYLGDGYYWWTNNFRQHLYLRTQLSRTFPGRSVERIGAYFEANTNDLYVYSWWPNRAAIGVYDILFFGAGVQVYFAPLKERTKQARKWCGKPVREAPIE